EDMEQYVGFYLDQSEYMIPVLRVREIINTPEITRVPMVPFYIEGITNLRGATIPLIDLKRLIGLNGTGGKKAAQDLIPEHRADRVIVIAHGGVTFGVLVDRISGIFGIKESDIESPEGLINGGNGGIKGIAKLGGRLAVLLDTGKIVPIEDLNALGDFIDVKEIDGDRVEVTRRVQTMGGEMIVKELKDARDFLEGRLDANDPRYAVLNDMIDFIDALANQDYEGTDRAIESIVKKGQDELYKEVGRITRTLHEKMKGFKEAVDPRIKEAVIKEMPSAIESLEFAVEKSEDAANRTMSIVEKYILGIDELSTHIGRLVGPEESLRYLRDFRNGLEDDLTEILTTQSFQDITGQLIKKVIKLIGEIEGELLRLITTFGVRIESATGFEGATERIEQADVDELLKEFGF
ncbi:MAG TPA: protein phosphatase CheZ, partial [Thermodesulfobacteriota bacterium]|nr:protein phosphatase CheZ [Thermodesulfobacteriota bacterium]